MNASFKHISAALLAACTIATYSVANADDQAAPDAATPAEAAAAVAPTVQDRAADVASQLAPPIVTPDGAAKQIDPAKDIDKLSVLPIRGLAIMRSKNGQTVLVSDTGRFVMTNVQILDTWNKGAILTSPEQMEYYGERIDPSLIPTGTLSSIHYGTGKVKVTAFVDPRCHYCHELYTYAQQHKAELDVTFILLPILGPESEALARRMTCQMASKKKEDNDVAAEALVTGDNTKLTTDEKCDLTSLRSNLVTASVFGIHGVPFVYGKDGRFVMGLPQPDVMTWAKTEPKLVPAPQVVSLAKAAAKAH